jgi:hypothetical protein
MRRLGGKVNKQLPPGVVEQAIVEEDSEMADQRIELT